MMLDIFFNKGVNLLRKFYKKAFGVKKQLFFNDKSPQYLGQEASNLIQDLLMSDNPCMIARFGSVELDCIKIYQNKNLNAIKKQAKYISGNIDNLDWNEQIKYSMCNNTGFFPPSDKKLDDFSKLMIEEMKNVDILGSWLFKENSFNNELKNARKVHLEDLVPFNHQNPWSFAFKNKKILVIHPFTESINLQFNRKELLFKDKRVLPHFELITYKPIQSFLGNYEKLEYNDWFEALEFMKKDISKLEFDIAILGCGSYGFPLASYIKKMGKKSIHMGGATQLIFGILGKRWEQEYDMSNYINEYWIRPSLNERPENFEKVENGCYW